MPQRAPEMGQERLNPRVGLGLAGDLGRERGLSLVLEKTQAWSFLK